MDQRTSEKYQVIYKGGLPEYSKSKASGINCCSKTVYSLRRQWVRRAGLVTYSSIQQHQRYNYRKSHRRYAEALLGGLDSRQLDHKNNIHIKFTYSGRPTAFFVLKCLLKMICKIIFLLIGKYTQVLIQNKAL